MFVFTTSVSVNPQLLLLHLIIFFVDVLLRVRRNPELVSIFPSGDNCRPMDGEFCFLFGMNNSLMLMPGLLLKS